MSRYAVLVLLTAASSIGALVSFLLVRMRIAAAKERVATLDRKIALVRRDNEAMKRLHELRNHYPEQWRKRPEAERIVGECDEAYAALIAEFPEFRDGRQETIVDAMDL